MKRNSMVFSGCLILGITIGFAIFAGEERKEPELLTMARQASPKKVFGGPVAAVKSHLKYHNASEIKFFYQGKDQKLVEHIIRHQLVISLFSKKGIQVLRYTVTDKNETHDVRDVYAWAEQNDHSRTLTKVEVGRMRELIDKLPDSKANPPIDETVHLSFLRDKEWQSITYDYRSLPEDVLRLIDILAQKDGIGYDLKKPRKG